MGKYDGLNNDGKPKANYLAQITSMDDAALGVAAENMIWLSAYANNNPKSDYHWMADAIYDECQTRKKPEIYTRAYDKAKAAAE